MTLRESLKQGSLTRFGNSRIVSVPIAMSASPDSTNSQIEWDCLAAIRAGRRVLLDESFDDLRST